MTRTRRVPNCNMEKALARTTFFSPSNTGGDFYTPQKDNTMQRLNKGYVNFNKSQDREPASGLGMRINPEPSYDYLKAVEAKTKTTKKRVVSMADFDRTSPRDDLLLQQTGLYKMIQLENTKDERELELKARKSQRSSFPAGFYQ